MKTEYSPLVNEVAREYTELQKLLPMKPEQQQTYWRKVRLEWNYNSNHIEGNTLTYGQTELLLMKGEVSATASWREHEEMKGHDLALLMVTERANDKERPLTEAFVRELNNTLLREPFWKEAITSTGEPTRIQVLPGQYKSLPNSVRLETGDIFHYASPEETPAKMQELMQWYENETQGLPPVVAAALLHYRFVRIHPFDDGNGRVARLIMNYHLLRNGYPPVIIKTTDKSSYLRALSQADTGNLNAFVDYIARQTLSAISLMEKALKNESLEEAEDWKKEVEMLKRGSTEDLRKRFSMHVGREIMQNSVSPLVEFVGNELDSSFAEMFMEKRLTGSLDKYRYSFGRASLIKNQFFKDEKTTGQILSVEYRYNTYKRNNVSHFNVLTDFYIAFEEFRYVVFRADNDPFPFSFVKLFHEQITIEEMRVVANSLGRDLFQQIKNKLEAKK